MNDDPYVYPGTSVLRNKFGIESARDLDQAERLLTTRLRAIHGHLFQDVYAWAGEIRTVEIAKSGHQFMFRRFIESGMADVHRRIVAGN